MTDVTAVIPLKAVHASKTRMAGVLSPEDRALLLQRTFHRVAEAVASSARVVDCLVVAGDRRGADWARDLGLPVMAEPDGNHGLNVALRAADAHLGGRSTLVLPADLPLVSGEDLDLVVGALPAVSGVVVAGTNDGGTGALVRSPGGLIPPRFGPDSARRHIAEARRAGVACRQVVIPGLALDLDQPADLDAAGGWSAITGARTLAHQPSTFLTRIAFTEVL